MKVSIKNVRVINWFVILITGIVIVLVMGTYVINSINNISTMSNKLSRLQTVRNDISNASLSHYSWRENLIISAFSGKEFTELYDTETCPLEQLRKSHKTKEFANNAVLTLFELFDEPHRFIHSKAEEAMNLSQTGYAIEAQEYVLKDIIPNADASISLLSEIQEQYDGMIKEQINSIREFEKRTKIALTVLIILIAIEAFLSINLCGIKIDFPALSKIIKRQKK